MNILIYQTLYKELDDNKVTFCNDTNNHAVHITLCEYTLCTVCGKKVEYTIYTTLYIELHDNATI